MVDLKRIPILRMLQNPLVAFLVGMGVTSFLHSYFTINSISPMFGATPNRLFHHLKSHFERTPSDSTGGGRKSGGKLRMVKVRVKAAKRANKSNLTVIGTDFEKTLGVLNSSGGSWLTFSDFSASFQHLSFTTGDIPATVYERMLSHSSRLNSTIPIPSEKIAKRSGRIQLNVATIVCTREKRDSNNLFKSLLIFTQDAELHLIVFSDSFTILDIGQELLALKWLMQRKRGYDFSFELHRRVLPEDNDWKAVHRVCTSQKLFFPTSLPHHEALLYLNPDTIVVSNLSSLWQHVFSGMGKQEMIAMTPNSEDSARRYYTPALKIPYFGTRGLDSAVVAMNLTRLREFKFEHRATAANSLFKERIKLADQDILNIVFSGFPEYVMRLNCSYNFNLLQCEEKEDDCKRPAVDNFCFCKSAKAEGIHIVNGNGRASRSRHPDHSVLQQLNNAIASFSFVRDSALALFQSLRKQMDELSPPLCKPQTSDILYDNAIQYLKSFSNPF